MLAPHCLSRHLAQQRAPHRRQLQSRHLSLLHLSPLHLSPLHLSPLRGLAHPLRPVVMIGKEGLTEAVVAKTDAELAAHELMKIRFQAAKDEKGENLQRQAERTLAVTEAEVIAEVVQAAYQVAAARASVQVRETAIPEPSRSWHDPGARATPPPWETARLRPACCSTWPRRSPC